MAIPITALELGKEPETELFCFSMMEFCSVSGLHETAPLASELILAAIASVIRGSVLR